MPVTLEPLPGDRPHGLDRPKFGLARSPEMDRLNRHCAIMHQPPVEACSGVIPEHWPSRASSALPFRRRWPSIRRAAEERERPTMTTNDMRLNSQHVGGMAAALGVASAMLFVVGWAWDHQYVQLVFAAAPIVAIAGLAF